ncbi:DUF1684 domain-containing protein [Tsukamurella sp. 8F]|uniref:DUF1684 domain-containing protein n=1 Tax=unclassified Tsukamurella TaxID=2633480 RepID=UPI0023BA15F7|nr:MULTISPECIES: DUF1684 domain-containing protein [unclassified Tsukamurella]MDF0532216.1 DUF1684 domain-containing protein [Tsukamurella sp. 8J]MDF0588079.1 DUF1684 domain-containing protein [Tsukamurella sp. 8F]
MTTASPTRFAADWREWHAERERALAAPLGWLSITRLEWLGPEPEQFDGIPGTWWFDGDTAYLRADDGDGIDPAGRREFRLHPTGPGELVTAGEKQIEVARRGDGYLIRVHDPAGPVVAAFRGVPAFEPDEAWVLPARFEPYETPRSVTVGAVAEGLAHVYESPGELVIERAGVEHRLIAFNGKGSGLSVLFTDGTSGVTTYAANRTLAVAVDDDVIARGGAVELDFNRATNLPCAFIDFATCPLPPAGNRLPFDVTAGEQTPLERG